jgi:hypothetical protein
VKADAGVSTSWEGGCGGESDRRLILCKLCIHMYVNAKMVSVETVPGIGVGR